MSETILVIEDEQAIQNILKAFLKDAGYTVFFADDGIASITVFREVRPDLVLLDLMLRKVNGFAVCEILRKEATTPIIMLTALDDEDSQMKGFDVLADDYITKPFSMPLVLRRIEAVLRRAAASGPETSVLRYKNVTLNAESYVVAVDGEPVSLTAREFEILKLFMEDPGHVYTRHNLLNLIWDYDFIGDEKIINTHIKNIRKKLEVDCIETIRGVGYKLDS